MKKRLIVSIPSRHPAVIVSCCFMAFSAIIRLWHFLPSEMDVFTLLVQLLLPLFAALIFLASMMIGGNTAKAGAITATVLGVTFFIIKATTFPSVLHQTLCTILYVAVLLLFTATILGMLPTKKLLYPLFGLPLLYHIFVEDTRKYFFADPPVPVRDWMPELSVLCIMAGLLSLSFALKAKKTK